nr:MAG TPA: hypothetical protein [Caudoviricetes sp.]
MLDLVKSNHISRIIYSFGYLRYICISLIVV